MGCVLGEKRLEWLATVDVAARTECTERDTVVGGKTADESGALGLRVGDLEEVLAGQLQRGLDCFGAWDEGLAMVLGLSV